MERSIVALNELGTVVHVNAVAKGFYEEIKELLSHPDLTMKQKDFIWKLWVSNRFMLIVSEMGEAMEGLRKGNMSCDPQSGGVGEELADTTIRLLDLAVDLGMDFDATVAAKMQFNATREYKHGDRAL